MTRSAARFSSPTRRYRSARTRPDPDIPRPWRSRPLVGYDTFGDQVEDLGPDGVSTETKSIYDADSRQVASILPTYTQPGTVNSSSFTAGTASAAESTAQFNELGEEIDSYDPSDVETTYAYDQQGNQTSITNAANTSSPATTAISYDPDGQTLSQSDADGNTQEAAWDYLGRQTSSTTLLNETTATPGCTELVNGTQAACSETMHYADPAGFLSSQTTPGGVATSYGYDSIGEPTSVTDGANQTSTTVYDFAGRPVKQTNPDGTFTTATYDQVGNQIGSAIYASGGTTPLVTTGATYDADGNMVSQTDAMGYTEVPPRSRTD